VRKIDLCLAFSKHCPDNKQHYAGLGPTQLSQMAEEYSSGLALFMGIEIKRYGKGDLEAQSQLRTWLAAGVIHLRKLRSPESRVSNLPILGWIVIGDEWRLYVAFGESDEETAPIVILGPMNIDNKGSTSDLLGIFRLFRLMQMLKTWATEVYWPWFTKHIMEVAREKLAQEKK